MTQDGRTAGLAVEGGRPENFLVSPKLGGIVITHEDGVIIGDLREGMRLPGIDRDLRPVRSLTDFVALLRWLDEHDASAFQTHVLASELGLTIDASKSQPDLRERRLLVTARYRNNPIVAVMDIPGSNRQSLFAAAVATYAALTTPEAKGGPGLTVTGIANLDVGSFDILEARTMGGEVVRRGPVGIGGAHNLVTLRGRR